ncbi:WD40 repeat protein [Giardia muris]|uniref:WD40 repeat protein n=1 Tax=Giardia muris TaxID=5742 RepID=A0A4Z1SR47_GIAMU|nr:WD40 repeat protein [Giardia muris]|eukprot:TNJ27435.1 WD40 repeat protein [Giardia muris]
MRSAIGTSHQGGVLAVWDPRGPTVYWQSMGADGDANLKGVFAERSCISIRSISTHLHLYGYDDPAPLFRAVIPFEAMTARLDQDYLYLTSTDGHLAIWAIATGLLLGIVQLHARAITTLDLRDGYLLTGGDDGTITLWSVQSILTAIYTGTAPISIATSSEHAFPVLRAIFAPFQSHNIGIYSASRRQQLRFWRLHEGSRGFLLKTVMSVTLPAEPVAIESSPDGSYLYVLTDICLYGVPIGGPDVSERICLDTPVYTEIFERPSTLGSETFTCMATCAMTHTMYVGTSAGSLVALLPGGGMHVYPGRDSLPVESIYIIQRDFRDTIALDAGCQKRPFLANLSRTPCLRQTATLACLKSSVGELGFGQLYKVPMAEQAGLGHVSVPLPLHNIGGARCMEEAADGLEKTTATTLKEPPSLDFEQACTEDFLLDELSSLIEKTDNASGAMTLSRSAEYMTTVQANSLLREKVARLTRKLAIKQLNQEFDHAVDPNADRIE